MHYHYINSRYYLMNLAPSSSSSPSSHHLHFLTLTTTPKFAMEEYSQYSLSTLLCGEDESCFDHFKDECFNFNFTSVSDFDSEYIRMLIRNEAIFESKYSVQNEGIRWKRRDAANWILDVCFSTTFC